MVEVTLDSVGDLFQEWRATRLNRSALIPEELWDLAVSLYPQYKRSKICKHLSLCASKFRQRLMLSDKIKSSGGFVLANVDVPKPVVVQPAFDIKLTIQGHERSLNVYVGIDSLAQVLPHFKALL